MRNPFEKLAYPTPEDKAEAERRQIEAEQALMIERGKVLEAERDALKNHRDTYLRLFQANWKLMELTRDQAREIYVYIGGTPEEAKKRIL